MEEHDDGLPARLTTRAHTVVVESSAGSAVVEVVESSDSTSAAGAADRDEALATARPPRADTVAAVRYLLSEDARYVNGANIQISGGWGI